MAVPLAGMILADFGAEVVKVEPPGGEFARGCAGFEMWNRGKASAVADLRADDERQRVIQLATCAGGSGDVWCRVRAAFAA
jgi:crotonobetainyl-CoA:carnitine CoA-transferase CaiB-like acyl-CoA transferase